MTHHTGSDEGLSEGERKALEMAIHNAGVIYSDGPIWRAVERILAARAAAPDALRERVEALAAEWEQWSWHFTDIRKPVYASHAKLLRAALGDPTDGAGT